MNFNCFTTHHIADEDYESISRTSYDFMDKDGKLITEDSKFFRKKSAQQNSRIEKELKKADKIYNSTIRLLLLGPGESGKSTVLKQMRLIHSYSYTEGERRENFEVVKKLIRNSMVSILKAMENFDFRLGNELIMSKKYILENSNCPMIDSEGFSLEKFWDCIEDLWRDDLVRIAVRRGGEYHLTDSAEYFFNRVYILRKPDSLLDDQDMLRSRVLTTGIIETKFNAKGINFHIFDVGGQRDQRKKWIQCFDHVTAIIFVADISSFNTFLAEDNTANRLQEALTVFYQIWNNRYLYHVSIILFLNKYDTFNNKILKGDAKLENYFPRFKNYKVPENINPNFLVKDENPEVTRAKMFILEEFINITDKVDKEKMIMATQSAEVKRSLEMNSSDSELYNKFCIPYFTCAVDTNNIRRVFKSCRNILRKENMIKSGLL